MNLVDTAINIQNTSFLLSGVILISSKMLDGTKFKKKLEPLLFFSFGASLAALTISTLIRIWM